MILTGFVLGILAEYRFRQVPTLRIVPIGLRLDPMRLTF